jgi:hypothetical protein
MFNKILFACIITIICILYIISIDSVLSSKNNEMTVVESFKSQMTGKSPEEAISIMSSVMSDIFGESDIREGIQLWNGSGKRNAIHPVVSAFLEMMECIPEIDISDVCERLLSLLLRMKT